MLLKDLTWPEVKSLDFDKLAVIFPTGSFEQHGPHLPFTTDTDIVSAIAHGVERVLADRVLLLPTLWPGLSTHHMYFPGTMDVPQTIYIQLIVELGKSMASMGARRVFILNGHGGNDTPLRAALRELKTAVPETRFAFASYWTLAATTLREVR
jgi:creatinine amidohydrolase